NSSNSLVTPYCSVPGVKCDGSTDDVPALTAYLVRMQEVKLGVILEGTPGKTSVWASQLNIPNTGVTRPGEGLYMQVPIVIDGQCVSADPALHDPAPTGCFTIDMTANVSPKVTTYGSGVLTLKNTVFEDTNTDCGNYWFDTTNTRLDVLDNTFVGSAPGWTASCSKLFELGGTTTTIGNGTNDAFEGYGTIFWHNTFHRFQHTIDAFTYANSINVEDNIWAEDNGSSIAGDSYNNVTGYGTGGLDDSDWFISGNLVEMTNISYFFSGTNWQNTTGLGNNFFDAGHNTRAMFHFGAGSDTELISCGDTGKGVGFECTDTENAFVNDLTPGYTRLGEGVTFNDGYALGSYACAQLGGTCVYWNYAQDTIFRTNNTNGTGLDLENGGRLDGFQGFAAFNNTISATSSANLNSPPISSVGQIWDGSSSVQDFVQCALAYGNGINPPVNYNCTHTGSTGPFSWTFPSGATMALPSVAQPSTNTFAGTCAMSLSTSCTITISHAYSTPVCIATVQGDSPIAGACSVNGTTVTITAASSNSDTWTAMVMGNPN
ncbi:MAG TPA: hypothetical protein VJQ54_04220, partial [Candidatus Sulfotelmatobacter sp.]|nr:hypothetical protein [Candidatus Sulfotelmatobacter sp.]